MVVSPRPFCRLTASESGKIRLEHTIEELGRELKS